MVMAVKLARHGRSQKMLLFVGYEAGITAAFELPGDCTGTGTGTGTGVESAQLIYLSQPHTQPILSLDASPDGDFYFTSSADAIVAMHRIPELGPALNEGATSSQSHKTEDESLLSEKNTIGTTPSTTSPPESGQTESESQLADSETSLEFAKSAIKGTNSQTHKPGGLSSLLSSSSASLPRARPAPPVQSAIALQPPYKTTNTKHAGQQSLRVRSDGRLLVTGGWDARVRIYSSKTLKEVAVLKWHKEGVYAVAFGELLSADAPARHWVAAGAKDGKVSLWEVF